MNAVQLHKDSFPISLTSNSRMVLICYKNQTAPAREGEGVENSGSEQRWNLWLAVCPQQVLNLSEL